MGSAAAPCTTFVPARAARARQEASGRYQCRLQAANVADGEDSVGSGREQCPSRCNRPRCNRPRCNRPRCEAPGCSSGNRCGCRCGADAAGRCPAADLWPAAHQPRHEGGRPERSADNHQPGVESGCSCFGCCIPGWFSWCGRAGCRQCNSCSDLRRRSGDDGWRRQCAAALPHPGSAHHTTPAQHSYRPFAAGDSGRPGRRACGRGS